MATIRAQKYHGGCAAKFFLQTVVESPSNVGSAYTTYSNNLAFTQRIFSGPRHRYLVVLAAVSNQRSALKEENTLESFQMSILPLGEC